MPTLDDRLDDLADSLDEMAQMIRNRNGEDMTPGAQTWDLVRGKLYSVTAEIWQTLSVIAGEETRWPQQS